MASSIHAVYDHLRTPFKREVPVLQGSYENGGEWEQAGLYKCCFIEAEGRYWMFYNAKDKAEWPWTEETGLAVSVDLMHWERYAGPGGFEPVMRVQLDSFYSHYLSDPHIRLDSRLSKYNRLYHFYCACRPAKHGDGAKIAEGDGEFRCIALRTSSPIDE
ncbi:hypothetical protein A8990_17212 [Paenibacillus taihuensis]|uniref:Glycosyl hydrolase family 32 n=1 Tax=Paenibacillus taihuensis TaxID=1156355 RepID=A0A3D9PYZ1_9BACL|nr:hypothetical protein [Paenibacillus taihuensis]REE55360.1 hypothetical protein A8990_17212 [Paenibacillus taihuensis]